MFCVEFGEKEKKCCRKFSCLMIFVHVYSNYAGCVKYTTHQKNQQVNCFHYVEAVSWNRDCEMFDCKEVFES